MQDMPMGQTALHCTTGLTVQHTRETHLVLLVLPEQDVEGTREAPHCQHQQEQKPFDILNDCSEGVHERILGRLQYSALEQID